MQQLQVGVQFQAKGRWWYAKVSCPVEAYSAIEDERTPSENEVKAGLLFREIVDFSLEQKGGFSGFWFPWKSEDGADFKEWYEEHSAWLAAEQAEEYEQEVV